MGMKISYPYCSRNFLPISTKLHDNYGDGGMLHSKFLDNRTIIKMLWHF